MNLNNNSNSQQVGDLSKRFAFQQNIELIDLALLIDNKILVTSDFHLGYEAALHKRGILIPRHQFKDTRDRLLNIFKITGKIDTIVITGDLKHEFGFISSQEWRDISDILDLMQKYCRKIILLKGNHDIILGPIATKKGFEIDAYFNYKDILILHGDKITPESLDKQFNTIIMGHEHPAISISDGVHAEKVKCFLSGKWKGKHLIVVPSFNLITDGTDILHDKLLSPFLQGDLGNFEVYVVAEDTKVRTFGKISGLS